MLRHLDEFVKALLDSLLNDTVEVTVMTLLLLFVGGLVMGWWFNQ